MCKQPKCNPIRHFFRLCRHDEITTELQHKVVETRQKTNEELMDFNAQLNLIIKDEDIRLTLTNINKITKKGKK
jgi:hypothetical protein